MGKAGQGTDSWMDWGATGTKAAAGTRAAAVKGRGQNKGCGQNKRRRPARTKDGSQTKAAACLLLDLPSKSSKERDGLVASRAQGLEFVVYPHTDGYCYKLVATIITEQPL
jgi:hypothetical protein